MYLCITVSSKRNASGASLMRTIKNIKNIYIEHTTYTQAAYAATATLD